MENVWAPQSCQEVGPLLSSPPQGVCLTKVWRTEARLSFKGFKVQIYLRNQNLLLPVPQQQQTQQRSTTPPPSTKDTFHSFEPKNPSKVLDVTGLFSPWNILNDLSHEVTWVSFLERREWKENEVLPGCDVQQILLSVRGQLQVAPFPAPLEHLWSASGASPPAGNFFGFVLK